MGKVPIKRMDSVEISTEGVTGKVVVNGLNISDCVTGYNVRHQGGDTPRIDLYLQTPFSFKGPAHVFIPDHTRAALIALGWTAPPEQKKE